MKRYKFVGDFEAFPTNGTYGGAIVGKVYDEDDELPNEVIFGVNVKYYVETYPSDWELVEVVETDEVIIHNLIIDYWFDEDGAKKFLSKFNEVKEIFSNNTTIYEIADFVNKLK